MFANKPRVTDENRDAADALIEQAISGISLSGLNRAFREAGEKGQSKLWASLFPQGGHPQSLYKLYRFPAIPALHEDFIRTNPTFRQFEQIIVNNNYSIVSARQSFYGDDIIIQIRKTGDDNGPKF